jgi:hypothetical protein
MAEMLTMRAGDDEKLIGFEAAGKLSNAVANAVNG